LAHLARHLCYNGAVVWLARFQLGGASCLSRQAAQSPGPPLSPARCAPSPCALAGLAPAPSSSARSPAPAALVASPLVGPAALAAPLPCGVSPAASGRSLCPWRCARFVGRLGFAGGCRGRVASVGLWPSWERLGWCAVSRALVGFEGSRRLSPSFRPLVVRIVRGVLGQGRGVATGCAAGADALVRSAAGDQALVFSVASGQWGRGRAAFARRSAALVRAVVASGPGASFVAFVSAPCPAGIAPARSWRSGRPVSGSWSALALAAGLGLPVYVFWCGSGKPALPAAWGSWSPVAAGPFAGGWELGPAQLELF